MGRKSLAWHSVILVAAFISCGQCHAQSRYTLFEDQFEDNRNAWLLGDREKTLAKIDSGSFYLESKREKHGYSRWIPQGFIRENQDFEILMGIKQVKGDLMRGYGLQWGVDPLENRYHELWLRKDGKFSVSTYDRLSGIEVDHQSYRTTNAFNPETFNQLMIRKEGGTLSHFINGIKVFEMPFTGIYGPELGFICPPSGAIRVDYLKINLLNDAPSSLFLNESTPNIFLISIGIADYKHDDIWSGFNDLQFTVNDANTIHQFFANKNVGALPEDNMSTLLDDQATKTRIMGELKQQLAKSWVNDLVIFYFAGHGITDPKAPEKPLYLLPYDFKNGNLKTAIHYKEIEELFESSPAKNKLLIIDACHSGGSLAELSGSFIQLIKSLNSKDMAVLTSSALGETSLELSHIKRGLFSYYFMEGLTTGYKDADTDDDGVVTIVEIYEYTREKTAKIAARRKHKQNPQMGGRFNPRLPLTVFNKKD